MSNRSSVQVAALDAMPPGMLGAAGHSGMYAQKGFLAVPTGDTVGGVYRMIRVPANAVIYDLMRMNTLLTGLAAHVGVYRTPDDGGGGVHAFLFGNAAALGAFANTPVSILNLSGQYPAERQALPLWQAALMPAPPLSQYLDISLTLTAASTTAGMLTLQVYYAA